MARDGWRQRVEDDSIRVVVSIKIHLILFLEKIYLDKKDIGEAVIVR